MTTPHQTPATSPRFADIVPTEKLGIDPENPDHFAIRELDTTVATNPDGSPRLVGANHHITPLDLAVARDIVNTRRDRWEGHDADETPYSDTPKRQNIRDSSRRYVFDGIRLAQVSSDTDYKPRWTEIEIYRTNGGMFISHRIGSTAVAHIDGCRILTEFNRRYATINSIASDEIDILDRAPCPECLTEDKYDEYRTNHPEELRFERDRHTVTINETPEDLIQTLYTTKKGVRKLGPLAASALQIAADRSPELAAVFYANDADTA
jgi:hypothetical protein